MTLQLTVSVLALVGSCICAGAVGVHVTMSPWTAAWTALVSLLLGFISVAVWL